MEHPVVNQWYKTLTGKLLKVRMISYTGANVSGVIIVYSNGKQHHITNVDWDMLLLTKHNEVTPP